MFLNLMVCKIKLHQKRKRKNKHKSIMNKTIEELQQILQNDPYDFQTRRTLSIALLNEGFVEEAKTNLIYLVQTFPENAELLYNLGIAYERLKQFEKAQNAYIRAIELSPETDFFYNLGVAFMEDNKFDEAIPVFEKVVEVEPEDSNSFFNIGLCYFRKKEYKQALEYFQKTIFLNKDDLYAHFYLGNIYKVLKLYDMARDEFNKVLNLSPDYSWAYFNLGSIAYELGDTENAIYYLKNTLKYNPLDIDAINILSKILIKQERYMEVEEILGEASENNPDNGDIYYNYAQVYKRQENLENYQSLLKLAVQNYETLTYPFEGVKKELKRINKIIGDIEG